MFRFIAAALLCVVATDGFAKNLKVLTGAGMSMPVKALAADFAARTDDHVTVVSDTTGGVEKRKAAGQAFDLAIATQTVVQTLTKAGKVSPRHTDLAQMVAGIGVHFGTPKPAIADANQVRATLLAAKTISYLDPASGGITGVFFLGQADKLGIGQQVRAKAVLEPNGAGVAAAVASGKAQYGVALISGMLPNKSVMVLALPGELQMSTIYAAAVASNAENAMDARLLLDDLRGPKGRDASLRAGLKPVAN